MLFMCMYSVRLGNKTSLIRFIDFQDHYMAIVVFFFVANDFKYNMIRCILPLSSLSSLNLYQNDHSLVKASQKIDQ